MSNDQKPRRDLGKRPQMERYVVSADLQPKSSFDNREAAEKEARRISDAFPSLTVHVDDMQEDSVMRLERVLAKEIDKEGGGAASGCRDRSPLNSPRVRSRPDPTGCASPGASSPRQDLAKSHPAAEGRGSGSVGVVRKTVGRSLPLHCPPPFFLARDALILAIRHAFRANFQELDVVNLKKRKKLL